MLEFRVRNQELIHTGDFEPIVADSAEYLEASFIFETPEWSEFPEIHAYFKCGSKVLDFILDDGKIRSDMHLNLSAGHWSVYLKGVVLTALEDGTEIIKRRIPTTTVYLDILSHGPFGGDVPGFTPPTVFEQYISKVEKAEADRRSSEAARAVYEEYDNSKKYVVGNKVAYEGSSYVLVKDAPAGTLPTDTDFWLLFAARGERGKPGSATNLTDGEGVGSVESVDGSKAISDNAVALGKDTIAGCKGYYIKSINLNDKKIYLCTEKVKPTISDVDNTDKSFNAPTYDIGAGFNIINKNHYVLRAAIKAISNNVVTYEGDLGFTQIYDDQDIDGHTFSVPSQPEIGVVSIADNAVSFGDGSKASAANTIVAGEGGIGAGANGANFGAGNTSGYGGLVSGAFNYSPAQHGTTGGEENVNTAYCTDVHGWRLIGKGAAQCVRGIYNIADKLSKFLFIVGNGKSETERDNAFTVGRDNNTYHRGDAYVHTTFDENGVKSAGDKLATTVEVNNLLRLKAPLYKGLQISGKVYSGGYKIPSSVNLSVLTDSKTNIVYDHITVNNVNASIHLDNYTIAPRVPTNGGTLYYKLLMRTNQVVIPSIITLGFYDASGKTVSGSVRGTAEISTLGNGEWEQVVIAVSGTPANAVDFKQIHLHYAGYGAQGSNFGSNAYFDVAGWAAFDDLDRARAYDLTVDASDATKYGYDVQKNIDEKASKTEVEELRSRLESSEHVPYTYGTEDIEAGSVSTAPTGTIHFVYE